MNTRNLDKAGQKYWDDSWASSALPHPVDPADPSLLNWVNRRFHQFFSSLFDRSRGSSMTLLELGCATSAWLPYFAKEYGFSVCGLDYSPVGSQLAREVLRAAGVEAQVVCADLFSPPQQMLGTFDVVVSFGVAEHFEDTASFLAAAASYLKPGGMLITSIPNMTGLVGSLQKTINKPVYDIHQLIDVPTFKEAHARAGLSVSECDYFIFTNFGVSNLMGVSTRTPGGFLKQVALGILARASMLMWRIEDRLGPFGANRITSPYINCVARKS